jgi:hypothetical protein
MMDKFQYRKKFTVQFIISKLNKNTYFEFGEIIRQLALVYDKYTQIILYNAFFYFLPSKIYDIILYVIM